MKRKEATPPMKQTIPVRLNDPQLLQKCKQLATVLTRRKGLRHDLNSATKRIKADVAVCDAQIEQLRQELETGFEQRPQGDLFAQDIVQDDGKVPKDAAAAALGKIAERAGETKPSEPHVFTSTGRLECSICGAASDDPIHSGGDPSMLRHVFSPPDQAPADGAPLCSFQDCGLAEGADVHDLGGSRPEPVVAPRAEDAAPARPCSACKRGTCIAHAHAFEGDAMKCARCDKPPKAKIHKEPEGGYPVPATVEPEISTEAAASVSGNGKGGEHEAPRAACSSPSP